MGRIKAIITDFDGTLVNTFLANYFAYYSACQQYGYNLTKDQYKEWYGLRYDELCKKIGIAQEHKLAIKELKKKIYPNFFEYLTINQNVLSFIKAARIYGLKTCIASTASRENLYNVLRYLNIEEYFDIVIAGENVSHGKPNPEVYNVALTLLDCDPDEVLVFEDSKVGCEAAENAELNYIKIINS
jgi:beta-phosphoglucomutase